MAVSKAAHQLVNENGIAATTSSFDLGVNSFGGRVVVNITNGATAPSAGCRVTVYVSTDGATWLALPECEASTTASARSAFAFDIDGFRYVRVDTGATSTAVQRTASVSAHVAS